MAGSVVARTWRETMPESIEHDLTALWRELAQQERVARAVMANLVVFRERTGAHAGDPDALVGDVPVDEVAARHPSRVIVIDHDREYRDDRAAFAAGVGVVTFGPSHARYAVEEIAVQSACAERSLPSIIRRLVRGDVPTSVWWAHDVSSVPPIEPIVAVGRQLVYDSRRWRDVRAGVSALIPFVRHERRLDLADLNWRRLTPLRHAILHAATSREMDALQHARVRIRHQPSESALAWLVVGWLTARLGWSATVPVAVEQTESDESLIVEVGEQEVESTAAMNDHRVLVTHRTGAAPFAVTVPYEEEADAVAAELRNLSHDVCLDETLSALADRFSAATST